MAPTDLTYFTVYELKASVLVLGSSLIQMGAFKGVDFHPGLGSGPDHF